MAEESGCMYTRLRNNSDNTSNLSLEITELVTTCKRKENVVKYASKSTAREGSSTSTKAINIEDYADSYGTEEYMPVNPTHKGKPAGEKTMSRYVCKLCSSYRTSDQQALQKHLSLHLAGKLHCEFCDFVASTCNMLVSHQRRLHMNDIKRHFACKHCEFKAVTKITLNDHYGKVHESPSHFCKLCKSKFMTVSEMKEHRLSKHSASTWHCNKCQEIFLAERGYQKHMERKVCAREQVTCQVCGYSCTHSQQLRDHVRRIHTKEDYLKCEMCSYTTGNSDLLKNHVRAQHLKIHPFKCKECAFSCVKAWQLTSHSRTHSGVRPYKCDMCQFDSAWNVQLKKHKKAHESVDQQRCYECSIVLANVASFYKHVRRIHVHQNDGKVNYAVLKNSHGSAIPEGCESSSKQLSTLSTIQPERSDTINIVETDKTASEKAMIKDQITENMLISNKTNDENILGINPIANKPVGSARGICRLVGSRVKRPEVVIIQKDKQTSNIKHEEEEEDLSDPGNICDSGGKTDVGTVTDLPQWKKDILSSSQCDLYKKRHSELQPIKLLRTGYKRAEVIKIKNVEVRNENVTSSEAQSESQKCVPNKSVNRKSKPTRSRRSKAGTNIRRQKAAVKCRTSQYGIQDMQVNSPNISTSGVQLKSLLHNIPTSGLPAHSSVQPRSKQLPPGVKFFIYPKKGDIDSSEGKAIPLTLYEVNPEANMDSYTGLDTQMEPINDSFCVEMEQSAVSDVDLNDGVGHKDIIPTPIHYSQNDKNNTSYPLTVRTSSGIITLHSSSSTEDAQYYPSKMDVAENAVSYIGDDEISSDTVVIQMQDENGYNSNIDVLANLQSGDWIAAPVSVGETVTDQSVLEYLSVFPLGETSSGGRNSNTAHENLTSQYYKQFTNLEEAAGNLDCDNDMEDLLDTCEIQGLQIGQHCVGRVLDVTDNATLTTADDDEDSLFPVQDIVNNSAYEYDVINM